jgi:hypothetical protein
MTFVQTRPEGYHLKRNMAYRAEKRKKLDAIKAERGCDRCPERDPCCLDFHHIDPATKTYTISRLYAGTWSWERILQEIALCEILCANCHRKEHHERRS